MSASLTQAEATKPAGTRPVWTTPRKLRAYLVAAWALVAIVFGMSAYALDDARRAVHTIGDDAAPSIEAAQEIGFALTDMDANLAAELIGDVEERAIAEAMVQNRRSVVTQRLVGAAENMSFDAERVPINVLFTDFGNYLQLASEVHAALERRDTAAAQTSYEKANRLLRDEMMPAAQKLDDANKKGLDDAFDHEQWTSRKGIVVVLLAAVWLAIVLGSLQLLFLRRMRRLLNPALLLATLLSIALAGFVVFRLATATSELREAKSQAFDSIHLLIRARTIAFDARGDEARWLLDPQLAPRRSFDDKVALLTTDREAYTPPAGLFAEALANASFEGERQELEAMVAAFRAYTATDEWVRKTAAAGQHTVAVDIAIGSSSDGVTARFGTFDDALGHALASDQKEFDDRIAHQEGALGTTEVFVPAASLAIALLAWLGVRARLKEYAA